WKCPWCTNQLLGVPESRCWCGNKLSQRLPGTLNRCFDLCSKPGVCPHNRMVVCRDFCHPGPCKIHCPQQCNEPSSPPASTGMILHKVKHVYICVPCKMWYDQFRDSCNGFNTRVKMNYGKLNLLQFNFHSLDTSIPRKTFYLDPAANVKNAEPFQVYDRISGGTSTNTSMAVDIDLDHHAWRIMRQNDTDSANIRKYFKSIYSLLSRLRTFSLGIANGTFTQVTKDHLHLILPELGLAIPRWRDFEDFCSMEPFMRVFNTAGLKDNSMELKSLLGSKWKNKEDPRIVMRTASFSGSGPFIALHVCMKEGNTVGEHWNRAIEIGKGIQDELLV
ncbi:hypothetical protein BJ875DRAFT_387058, partial [Amylocarpus encephaloides]